jgi:hypothetical protein
MSREKGRKAEIELCKLLTDELGIVVQRNRDQAANGGADCLQVPGFAVECKRCEQVRKAEWWRQAVEQALKAAAEPIVFFRRSREPWQALIRTPEGGYRVACWGDAMYHMREKLARLYGIYKEAA